MINHFTLEILTPRKKFPPREINSLIVFTDNGQVTILSNHEEYLANVTISLLTIVNENNQKEFYAINGGALHFINSLNKCILMVNNIFKADEIDAQKVEEERINAENALKSSTSTLEHKSAEMLLRKALNKKTIKDIYGK